MTPARARAILGVGSTASAEQIEAAFRRRAWSAHPDRGGRAAEFAELATARAVLVRPAPKPAGRPARPTPAPAGELLVVPDAALLRRLVAEALGRWVGRHRAGRRSHATHRRVS